jgi:hypothetical protein
VGRHEASRCGPRSDGLDRDGHRHGAAFALNGGCVIAARGDARSFGSTARCGDLNCDGAIDFSDINPFVLLETNAAAWRAASFGCPTKNGDINGDGTYGQRSFGDINPFVALLSTL